ncbi:MAG: toprim domain-containing protein, partial [Fimbriimonadales bacterium]|nr:toprim domain-containing protein [Fimbriimonadales bacterium]
YKGVDAVRIPYSSETGGTLSVQWRVGLAGERFRRTGSPHLYGLWRLSEYSGTNLWAVEGITDCWTLWHAGLPALGFPSASCDALLPDFWRIATRFSNIYLLLDNDDSGEKLLRKLAETCPPDLQERVKVVPLPDGCKDSGDLWVSVEGDAERFKTQLREALQHAQPLASVHT